MDSNFLDYLKIMTKTGNLVFLSSLRDGSFFLERLVVSTPILLRKISPLKGDQRQLYRNF